MFVAGLGFQAFLAHTFFSKFISMPVPVCMYVSICSDYNMGPVTNFLHLSSNAANLHMVAVRSSIVILERRLKCRHEKHLKR